MNEEAVSSFVGRGVPTSVVFRLCALRTSYINAFGQHCEGREQLDKTRSFSEFFPHRGTAARSYPVSMLKCPSSRYRCVAIGLLTVNRWALHDSHIS